jgi:hypothetical protein
MLEGIKIYQTEWIAHVDRMGVAKENVGIYIYTQTAVHWGDLEIDGENKCAWNRRIGRNCSTEGEGTIDSIISGFRDEADESRARLSHYAARIGNSLPTFRDKEFKNVYSNPECRCSQYRAFIG